MSGKTILFTLGSAIIAASVAIGPASATSCSEWVGECKARGERVTQATMPLCDKEARECKVRCKAGNKVFISPFTGKQYPVSRCN